MARKLISDLERFNRSIVKTEAGCWEWQLALSVDGYGRFTIGSYTDGSRKQVRAHRWSYEQLRGEIPAGLHIDHLCRNRRCVNPAHLEPVTSLENTQRGFQKTKPYCKHGHLLSGDNLYITPGTTRRKCRICMRRQGKERAQRTNYLDYKKHYYRNREKILAAKVEYRARKRAEARE